MTIEHSICKGIQNSLFPKAASWTPKVQNEKLITCSAPRSPGVGAAGNLCLPFKRQSLATNHPACKGLFILPELDLQGSGKRSRVGVPPGPVYNIVHLWVSVHVRSSSQATLSKARSVTSSEKPSLTAPQSTELGLLSSRPRALPPPHRLTLCSGEGPTWSPYP